MVQEAKESLWWACMEPGIVVTEGEWSVRSLTDILITNVQEPPLQGFTSFTEFILQKQDPP